MTYLKNKPNTHPTIKIGDKFGKWTVIDNTIVRRKNGGTYQIMVECDCKQTRGLRPVNRLISGYSTGCKTCNRSGSAHYKWRGVGRMSASVLYGIQQNAKRHNRKVELDLDYLWTLFLEQNERCALSGIKLDPWVSNNRKQGRRMTASLDRIDSNKDYVRGNVQWVHKDINKLKTDFSQDKFIELCKAVAKKHENS